MVYDVDTEPVLAPTWFEQALAVPFERRSVVVDRAEISFIEWGERSRPGLLFVHGGGAQAHWWTHIAAQFCSRYHVASIDLSGHGWSEHRAAYTLDGWAEEVMHVARRIGDGSPPIVIGHSMGGFVTIAAAAAAGAELSGIIVCDSPVTELEPEMTPEAIARVGAAAKVYPTVEDALRRFRTVPEQEHYLPYIVDHVARTSLREVPGGWTWRFDRQIFGSHAGQLRRVAMPYLEQLQCPFTLLRSEHGLVTADIATTMRGSIGARACVVDLPEAGHHAMLDQPLVLLTALRAVLAEWERI